MSWPAHDASTMWKLYYVYILASAKNGKDSRQPCLSGQSALRLRRGHVLSSATLSGGLIVHSGFAGVLRRVVCHDMGVRLSSMNELRLAIFADIARRRRRRRTDVQSEVRMRIEEVVRE